MNTTTFVYLGETAALTGAALWAVSSLLFERAGKTFTAGGLNFLKSSLALVMLAVTGWIRLGGLPSVETGPLVLLFLSGLIGIGMGDTAYFEAMRHMGTRRALLVGLLAPPLTAMIAWLSMDEGLPILGWLGIGVTLAGVAWVVMEERPGNEGDHRIGLGVLFGTIYAIGQAVGAVMTRMALTGSSIDLVWSIVIRLVGGVFMLALMAAVRRRSLWGLRKRPTTGVLKMAALATVLGTYLAMICQQAALKFAQAGIAQTLLMSSHLFLLPLGRFTGERISWRAVLGALAAMGGIALLFFRG